MIKLKRFSDAAFVIIVFLSIAISMFDLKIGALIWSLICLSETNVLYIQLTKQHPVYSYEEDEYYEV